ncbi:type VI secretion system lipoprotein TssJ [Azospirillum sp. ST 5-10]|uniref:type VI secretion system lipoprotein TssJ n=1 Tax=unclassified Azospirillum TaxID=2630922 RepID=UPI003F49D39B
MKTRTLGTAVRAAALAGALGAAAGLGACSSTPDPTAVSISVTASDQINPNSAGTPSPVVVRIYELSQPDVFKTADFFDIYDNDQQSLKGTMLGRTEVELLPGKTNKVDHEVSPTTRYLGVLAAFRELDGATWRALTNVVPEATNQYVVTVGTSSVNIQNGGTGGWLDGLF